MFRGRRRVSIALLLCCAPAVCGELAAQSGVRPERAATRSSYQPVRVSADGVDAPASGQSVAVVGSVAAPATYRFDRPATAGTALQAAGGLTSEASDNLLIIRQGRIVGPILFDPSDKELRPAGPLLDGDVLVFKTRRGVRTALYQTTDPGPLGARSVENAMQDRSVHVACIGLAPYPVVLPLPPSRATEQALLLELLGLPPQLAEQGVRRVTDGSFSHNDGELHDGTVLWFDPRLITAAVLRPVEPFPLPRAAISPDLQAPVEANVPAAIEVPHAVPPVGSVFSAPARGAVRVATNGGQLTQPPPGFPFVVRDAVPGPSAVVSGTAGFRAAEVLRGGIPIDVTEGTSGAAAGGVRSTPSRSLLTSAEFRSVSAESSVAPLGIREPTVARGLAAAQQIAALEGVSDAAPALPSALESPVDYSILGGVLLAAACCLGASILWAREERRRRAGETRFQPCATEHVRPISPSTATSLQQLLDNALPVIEEPAALERPARLHGPVVGQRRLMIDAPHAQVAAPHFALTPTAVNSQQQQRYERHLAAATTRSGRRERQPASGEPVAARSSSSPTFRYDVVEPESDPTPHATAPRSRTAATHGELLTRVLDSLRGGG